MISSPTTLGVFALSLLLTAVSPADVVSPADAGDDITSAPEKASAEKAMLRVHEIPREMSCPVLDRFSLIVPSEQMMYFAKTRKLVVYASPKIHNLVAERIAQDKDRILREDSSVKGLVQISGSGNFIFPLKNNVSIEEGNITIRFHKRIESGQHAKLEDLLNTIQELIY